MAVDFTPNLNPYSGQGSFRFWVQKVLPLVYDDSLSYYELLCKVVTFLNNVIQDMDTAEENIELLRDTYNQLQSYVNTYFDNLDIQHELDDIINRMVRDGRFENQVFEALKNNPRLLETPVHFELPGAVEAQLPGVVAEQIDAAVGSAIEEQVPPAVSDWLTENVEPVGSAVIVDSSLTVSGAAADAKVTGDKISDTGKAIGYITLNTNNGTSYPYYIAQGNTVTISGTQNNSVEFTVDPTWNSISVSGSSRASYICFLTTSCGELPNGADITSIFADPNLDRITIPANGNITYNIPEGTNIISIATKVSGTNRTPRQIGVTLSSGAYQTLKTDMEIDFANDIYSNASNVRTAIYSDGHMRLFKIENDANMNTYTENKTKGVIIKGSKFIKFKSGDIITFMGRSVSLEDTTTVFTIYFYDKNFNIDWQYLDYYESQYRNRILLKDLTTLNGLQITAVADGYLQVYCSDNTSGYVGIWDGISFGVPLHAQPYTIVDNVNVKLPSNGESVIPVPQFGTYLIAKPGYTFVAGYIQSSGSRRQYGKDTLFPTQCIKLAGMTGGTNYKNIILRKQTANSTYANMEFENTSITGDISSYVCLIILNENFTYNSVVGSASTVDEKADSLIKNFKWTPKKDVACNDREHYFKANVEYRGVPYRSSWSEADLVGWNVTKQTLQSAANDPNSVFYKYRSGPYYCLVCSSFSTLINGFSYPSTNYDLVHNPNIGHFKSRQPNIGMCTTDGYGHCITPIKFGVTNDRWYLEIAEGIGPMASKRVGYSGYSPSSNKMYAINSTYFNNYNLCCYPDYKTDTFVDIPYNVESNYDYDTLKTAVPDHGDCSVYTSYQDIIIDVNDTNATYICYQKFTGNVSRGIWSSAPTPDGTIYAIDINENTIETNEYGKRVMLEEKNTFDKNLENGAIYGVWCSTGIDADTPEENCITFFEYHNMNNESIQAEIVDGELKVYNNAEFWYCFAIATNKERNYNSEKTNGTVTIPYELPHSNIDGSGELIYNDYSRYRNNYALTRIVSFIRKGKFGAYKLNPDSYEPEPEED